MPTGSPVAKVMTRTSATGVPDAGFTLIELMVVLLIVSITMGLVTLSFRSPAQQPLSRDGTRLAAVLNLARDEAQLTGHPILLKLSLQGWNFFQSGPEGLSAVTEDELPAGRFNPPLDHLAFDAGEGTGTQGTIQYWLGVEEIDDFKGLTLQRGSQQVRLLTDGLGNYRIDRPAP